jgi:hypothetical protein
MGLYSMSFESEGNSSRDLKPGNCLISIGRGVYPRVLVGDFGEGNVEGSGKVGTGTIEVYPAMM